ncbi:hypothetical protein B7463_g10204, partial [Scytalidium lignicola]
MIIAGVKALAGAASGCPTLEMLWGTGSGTDEEIIKHYNQGNPSAQDILTRPPTLDMQNQELYVTAKRWLAECLRSHKTCQLADAAQSFRPGRLIDTTCSDPAHIYLIEKGNLCIIQDDADDIARELSNMHRVYEHAILTISAAKATHSDEGILGRCKPPLREHELKCLCSDGRSGSFLLLETPGLFSKQPIHQRCWTMQEHLLSRRILIFATEGLRWSCRTTTWFDGPYTSRELLLDDAEKISTVMSSIVEILPTQTSTIVTSRSAKPRNGSFELFPNVLLCRALQYRTGPHVPSKPQTIASSAYATWVSMLQKFTTRRISKPQDRLPAISALATKFATAIPGRYIAGHWEAVLAHDLLWRVMDPVGPPIEKYRDQDPSFPTWSWASINSQVKWERFLGSRPTLEILQVTTVLADQGSPYGQVHSAKLRVKGRILRVDCEVVGEQDRKITDWSPMDVGATISIFRPKEMSNFHKGLRCTGMWTILDESTFMDDLIGCWCLEILRFDPEDTKAVLLPSAGLLLSALNYQTMSFRRLGIFYMGNKSLNEWSPIRRQDEELPFLHNKSLFEECPVVEIEIV